MLALLSAVETNPSQLLYRANYSVQSTPADAASGTPPDLIEASRASQLGTARRGGDTLSLA